MKIEDVAKKVKTSMGDGHTLNQPVGVNRQVYVNITTAVNGFVVNANGTQAICTDIGQLQAFLEELYV
jgi:hypothetical protein